MNFLSCTPSVFVIGSEYEILVNTHKNGIITVDIGGVSYCEENSGVLSSEKNYAKIRVPQSALDGAKKYTVVYREAVNRKAYFSELSEPMTETFGFKPLTKTDGINIYHIADVHYDFEAARGLAAYFGDDLDVLVVNGDIGEVETVQNYFEVCKFVGDISHGSIPTVFVRGNHDTRGKLAERFTDFFPSNGKNTYFTFELGSLFGVALDCGEDKYDGNVEYGGVNVFESFRRRETKFLKAVQPTAGKTVFAVSHICPAYTTENIGDQFDIERDVYAQWNAELLRIGVKFMLTGHLHIAFVEEANSASSTLPHDYPIIVGSAHFGKGDLLGAALTLSEGKLTVRFTDCAGQVREEHVISL